MAYHLLSSNVTYNSFASRTIGLAFILLISGACDSGGKPKTRDDVAADSALAADLALANRDTLLIDSVGQYRAAEGALGDTGIGHTAKVKPNSPAPATVPLPVARHPLPVARHPLPVVRHPLPVTRYPLPVTRHPLPVTRRPLPVTRHPLPVTRDTLPRRTSGNPCNSPISTDQQACLRSSLSAADKRLNGIYRALITEMRQKGNARPGQSDPPSVVRLRTAQRVWMASRDTECRRRGRGKEGALWAYPRVHCLAEFSDKRANELADDFSRLTTR
jgi:uncharacterized protein YecT (DUF1311 family)